MQNLNRHTINIRGLNIHGLNGIDPLSIGGGGKPWEAYVQDGLIFQLDCKEGLTINYDGSATWNDLVGGIVLSSQSGLSKSEDGGVLFQGEVGIGSPLSLYKDVQAEFVIRVESDNPEDELFVFCDSYGRSYKKSSDALYAADGFYHKNVNDIIVGNVSSISSNNSTYLNGEELSVSYGKYPTFYNNLIHTKGKITIYSLRLYNRVLEYEEIFRNLLIDCRRFGITPPAPPVPENALVDVDGYYIIDAEGNYIIMQ